MFNRKFLNMLVSLMVLTSLVFGGSIKAGAAPAGPVDQTKVPHYFGPYTNWANSPLAMPDAVVAISGNGTGATADAIVGANGAITGINITNPGSGYTSATVAFTGSGTGATADAVVNPGGVVTAVKVDTAGAGYESPSVTITGGGATTSATATAFGGVDALVLGTGGSGYTMPTVDFDLPDDPNGVQAKAHAEFDATTGTVTAIVLDSAGSGYSSAPKVVIRDGTVFDPINGGTGALATATLSIQTVALDTFGNGYTSAPTVNITDTIGAGTGATATAFTDFGAITAINLTAGGSGYITPGGIHKFVDKLPGLTPAGINNLGQYIPIAQPDTTTFPGADYYVIAVVQHREKMHTDLPGTLMREYVQLSTSVVPGAQVALTTDLLNGGSAPVTMPDGTQALGVDNPHFLGPVIVATKDRAVRITFYNLIPTGADGNLFLPVDGTMMGSGMGPMAMPAPVDNGTVTDEVRNPVCTENPQDPNCFKNDRATLHLHGGTTPWISDGTAHQWITPATENTQWPQGVSVQNVPDMVGASRPAGTPDCSAANDGCETFYYTNQQSARLLFYHDHAWGITRLNVYAGEAAGYVITDPTDQKLFGATGLFPDLGVGTPLVIQDRTFVPSAAQLAEQDPTWDTGHWGGMGNLWYHHVYMPAQNPGDPSGMSAYGRWMYGPWFWPPATPQHGPIANPYFNMDPATGFSTPLAKACNLDDPTTWQYQVEPFCEPEFIPGTPNISVGMEQFNDTPIVNGTAYPTTTVDPKSYRFRILNAANDRFWNLQWYVADATGTEVALKAAEVAAAQTDVNVFPTPDTLLSPVGPSWIQIGSEGGFLPAPTVVPNQPITWITDPTRFDFGNVDKHSLLLAPAERADVIVDFSKYVGKTLILYNDAPAAFPARVASYDYYTGSPTTLPGYGPNTRTIMQVKVSSNAAAPAFNMTALVNAFKHHADGSGVFESGQHPVIVGQAAYNSAYGTSFAASGYCNTPTSTIKCDGFARINQQGGDPFTFDTLKGPKLSIPFQPKALHDEMNAATFDEFGRMTANLGVEAVPATPGAQTITLYPFVNPQTELIDGTNLPSAGIKATPISSAADGTQIWKFTHNGVDTHPIHFHLFDVQVLNRVTWDNIIMAPDANELGWKDTVRISPLEDTIVALRPVIPAVPFEVPNSVRELNPMMPDGDTSMFNNVDPNGNPTANIVNQLVNFGWEYTYHCHILSHEEMDMMRPVTLALPPLVASWPAPAVAAVAVKGGLQLTWNDNSITETAFVVQRTTDGINWVDAGTIVRPLDVANTHGTASLLDKTYKSNIAYLYRVVAQNTVGYGAEFPNMTVKSTSANLFVGTLPAAPTVLTATLATGPQVNLAWKDNSNNESGFAIERSVNGGVFNALTAVGAGVTSYTDKSILLGTTYTYRVAAANVGGLSAYSNTAQAVVPAMPTAPSNFVAVKGPNGAGNTRSVIFTWLDNSTNETGFTIQRASNAAFTSGLVSTNVAANAQTFTLTGLTRNTTYFFRIRANNGAIIFSGWVNSVPPSILTNP